MADTYEGNGASYTFSGLMLDVKTIELPGFSNEEIDISTLSNTAVKTKFVAALQDWGKLFLTLNFDASQFASLPTTEGSLVITIAGVGSITFYAQISERDTVILANDEQPLYRVGFTITNLNSGAETAPAFST